MSDPLHLGELRRRRLHPDDWVWITPEERAVLLAIAEAARDYFAQSLPYSNNAYADLTQENLCSALRKVTDPRYA